MMMDDVDDDDDDDDDVVVFVFILIFIYLIVPSWMEWKNSQEFDIQTVRL